VGVLENEKVITRMIMRRLADIANKERIEYPYHQLWNMDPRPSFLSLVVNQLILQELNYVYFHQIDGINIMRHIEKGIGNDYIRFCIENGLMTLKPIDDNFSWTEHERNIYSFNKSFNKVLELTFKGIWLLHQAHVLLEDYG
jgi:hypothetical protein